MLDNSAMVTVMKEGVVLMQKVVKLPNDSIGGLVTKDVFSKMLDTFADEAKQKAL